MVPMARAVSYLASAIAKGLGVIKIERSSRGGNVTEKGDGHGRETHDMLYIQESDLIFELDVGDVKYTLRACQKIQPSRQSVGFIHTHARPLGDASTAKKKKSHSTVSISRIHQPLPRLLSQFTLYIEPRQVSTPCRTATGIHRSRGHYTLQVRVYYRG